MDIVRFPKGRKSKKEVEVNNPLVRGPVSFTCPSCATKARFDFGTVTFRTVDFYCSGPDCGKYFKMVNPAFAPPK